MKRNLIAGLALALVSSGAMAANCEKNPSHPSCQEPPPPEPQADIGQLVVVDALDRKVALMYPNVSRGLGKIDGLPNIILFTIQPGSLDPNYASAGVYYELQGCTGAPLLKVSVPADPISYVELAINPAGAGYYAPDPDVTPVSTYVRSRINPDGSCSIAGYTYDLVPPIEVDVDWVPPLSIDIR